MNSALASLVKNLFLVAVLLVSAFNFFFPWLNWRELFALQSMVGFVYIFLSCYEYLNSSYKAALPVKRFAYFSNTYLMFKVLKIAVFLGCAALLFASDSRVKYIYPICLIISVTEGVITFLKFRNKLCFLNIYANYLLLVEDKMNKLFASEIMIVEFRHDIFYFVKKNQKTLQIKLEHIKNRDEFLQSIQLWLNRNNVLVSAESKVKIRERIA